MNDSLENRAMFLNPFTITLPLDIFSQTVPLREILMPPIDCLSSYVLNGYLCFRRKSTIISPQPRNQFCPLRAVSP